jgi:large subunit ribosomal protein L9
MKVLLIETVDNLGSAGEVKKVAEGYARNFLIPKGLAVPATEGALKQAELRRQAEARRQKREEMKAESLARNLSQVTLTLRAKAGEKDKLYGSITNADIAQALERETGQAVDKRKIELEEPIRELGSYRVPIKLLTDLAPQITVIVEREEETASGI